MTDALTIWREKLAGVTPLVEEARTLHLRSTTHQHAKKLDDMAMTPGSPDMAVSKESVKVVIALIDDLEIMVGRLADALECSGSRILAEEATVEGLAAVLHAANEAHDIARGWEGPAIAWEQADREDRDGYLAEARACLNHLAQLALGDGT